MPSTLALDPHSLARLELSLINTKSSTKDGRLLPSQACTRGGIGVFLSTGSARGSLSRLPEALKTTRSWQRAEASLAASSRPHSVERSSHASRRASTGASFAPSSYDVSSLAAAAAASVVVGGGALVPEEAKREWERSVAHPYNFVTTARQTRIDDVRPASKWAAVSFFENNPKEVKRHMDIMSHVDRAHYEAKMSERHDGKIRHFTWALQQREIFRRQRHEVAARYEQAGVPQRKAYGNVPSSRGSSRYGTSLRPSLPSRDLMRGGTAPDSQQHFDARGSMGGMMESWEGFFATSAPVAAVSLPKPNYPQVYKRMSAEVGDTRVAAAEHIQRRAEDAARQKEGAETRLQLANMDAFEMQLKAMQRERGRGILSKSSKQEEADD